MKFIVWLVFLKLGKVKVT